MLHGRKGLTPTIYVAPFLTPYANQLGQARTGWSPGPLSPGLSHRIDYLQYKLDDRRTAELSPVDCDC